MGQEGRDTERSPGPPARPLQPGEALGVLLSVGVVAVGLLVLVSSSSSCRRDANLADGAAPPVDSAVPGRSCDAEPNNWTVTDPSKTAADVNLFDVWGAGDRSVWAVGSGGTVLHYDGSKWAAQKTPTTETLTSVWGLSDKNVWAAGFGGTVLHYDGTSWTSRNPPDTLFREDDAGAVPKGDAAVGFRTNFWGVWAAGNATTTQIVYAVGDSGTVMVFTKNAWQRVDSGVQEKLTGVWGPGSSRVYIVGDFGTILCGKASKLTKQQTGVAKALRGVGGSGGGVYAVGLTGTILYGSGSCGGKWREVKGAPPQVLRDVWALPGSKRVYIVGWDGVMLRLTGGPSDPEFAEFNCVTGKRLEGVWGTPLSADAGVDGGARSKIWVVGVSGTVVTGP